MTKKPFQNVRLGSIDVLRGFDLFCLVFFQPVLMEVSQAADLPFFRAITPHFKHVAWEGFAFWDIIMPLFMFITGASMPFAFSKYTRRDDRKKLYRRILRRVLLLWILGMVCQGNLLGLDPQKIYLFSNTLQAIAVGYLISALLLLHLRLRWQIVISAGLLLSYWALLTFVQAGSFGGGNFTPDYNLAEYVDRIVLGRFRDGVTVTETGLDFGNYRYTWILSSLNFGVTVMTGVFAGQILKGNLPKMQKVQWLIIGGIAMVVAGLLWGFQMPVIKKIWTSSMTLYSSGLCFLLMALFYYLVDIRNGGKYLNWLKIYGMNSITAYMLYSVINFGSISRSLLYGTKQYLGEFYPALITLSDVSLIFLILWILYRRKIFLKI